jgi:hypothetical protein
MIAHRNRNRNHDEFIGYLQKSSFKVLTGVEELKPELFYVSQTHSKPKGRIGGPFLLMFLALAMANDRAKVSDLSMRS